MIQSIHRKKRIRVDRVRMAVWSRQTALWLAQALGMMLLGGSRLLGELTPFSAAAVAAGLAGHWSWTALLTGCVSGFAIRGDSVSLINAFFSALIIPADYGLRRLIRSDEGRGALEAGMATLLAGLSRTSFRLYEMLTVGGSVCIAALLAPALMSALTLRRERMMLLPEEKLSIALWAMILLIAAGCFPYGGSFWAQTAAVFGTLLLSRAGAAMGALGGLGAGAGLALGLGVASAGSVLGLGGLLAGCVCLLPRLCGVLALAAGNMLALNYGIGYTLGAIDTIPLLAGGLLYVLCPAEWIGRTEHFLNDPVGTGHMWQTAMQLCREQGLRLERAARVMDLIRTQARACSADGTKPGQSDGREGLSEASVSERLRAASDLLRQTGHSLKTPSIETAHLEKLAASVLDELGIRTEWVSVCRINGLKITLGLRKNNVSENMIRLAAQRLSEETGCLMTVAEETDTAVCLSERPRMAVTVGRSGSPFKNDEPCGDTVYTGLLPDGRFMTVLSDGMGSGIRAARQSQSTVAMIRAFWEAGWDDAQVFETINGILQTREGADLFATVDLCVIDLRSGRTRLSKLGACSSLLMTGNRLIRLSGGHLPIGMVDGVVPGEIRFRVKKGDRLILFSDGVADDLKEGQWNWMKQNVRRFSQSSPGDMARSLRRAALRRDGGKPRDDMTVVVIALQ